MYQLIPPSGQGLTFSRRRTTTSERKAMGFASHREINHFAFTGATALAAYADANAKGSYKNKNYKKGTSGVDSSWSEMLRKARIGDIDLGNQSDKLMTKFENLVPLRKVWSTRNDVVGGLPN